MLVDFFKLNSPYDVFGETEKFTELLVHADSIKDILFQPESLTIEDLGERRNLFSRKTFTNVSFSKTTISGITFRDCNFVDSLFIGTHFVDCEFHDCTFKGCNPHKVTFENTYIDPAVFEGMLDTKKYSNIGINLFHQLYDNSIVQNQREFANTAEFNRQKWRRYVLNYKYSGKKNLFNPNYRVDWISNWLFYLLAGYGIRAKFWISWAFIVVVSSFCINYFLWEQFNIVGKNGSDTARSLIKAFYYTVTIPAGLGDYIPTSDLGRISYIGEGFLGLVIVSLFVTWFVKRILR